MNTLLIVMGIIVFCMATIGFIATIEPSRRRRAGMIDLRRG